MKKIITLLLFSFCLLNAKSPYELKSGNYNWLKSQDGKINIFINQISNIKMHNCGKDDAFSTKEKDINLSSFYLYEDDKKFDGEFILVPKGIKVEFKNKEEEKSYILSVDIIRNSPIAKLSFKNKDGKKEEISLQIKEILPITLVYYFNKDSKVCYFDMNIDTKKGTKKAIENKAKTLSEEEKKNVNYFGKMYVTFQNDKFINIKNEILQTQGNDEIKNIKSSLYTYPDFKLVKLSDITQSQSQSFVEVIKNKESSIDPKDIKNAKIYEMKKDGIVIYIPSDDEGSYLFISNKELKDLEKES